MTIPVLAAMVLREGRYLVCQRPAHKRHGGLWEFPGGKMEDGESDFSALERELEEELALKVVHVGTILHSVRDPGSDFEVHFLPVEIAGQPQCLEHAEVRWASLAELIELPLAPSDRRFVQDCLVRNTTNRREFSKEMSVTTTSLAHDDTGGSGRLVLLLPGAGDVRSENRFLVSDLAAAGYRVVSADLPGHGGSPPAPSYGVSETADALLTLVDRLDSGPAIVIATSFAPAAAVWAAVARPDRFAAFVAISPHLESDDSFKGKILRGVITMVLRGPWAGAIWARLYRSWYKSAPPNDLDAEVEKLTGMLSEPTRRRAVRDTLTAHREGLAERISAYSLPTLVVFGEADDHFPDPAAELAHVSSRLGGEPFLVEGVGHYPHVERPDLVGPAVVSFLDRVTTPSRPG